MANFNNPFAQNMQVYDPATGQTRNIGSGGPVPGLPQNIETFGPTGTGTDGNPGGGTTPTNPFGSAAVPTGAQGTTGQQINDWYSKYLGEDISGNAARGAEAWNAWANLTPQEAEAGIKNSDQARAFAASQVPKPAAASGPAASAPGMPAKVAGLENNPFAKDLAGLLMRKAGASADVSPDDPTIKAQTEAFRNRATRGARDIMTLQAEKGGPYQNQSAVQRSALEKAGQATAGFQADLLSDERKQRRQDIQNALTTGASFLTAQQAQALQEELNRLNLQQRAYEFDSNYFLNTSPFGAGAVA